MNIYNKNNIINFWDEILPKSYYKKLYDEIKYEILNDIFKEEYSKLIDKGLSNDFNSELINENNHYSR